MQRKILKISIALLLVLISISAFTVLIFYSPPVQTYLTQKVSRYLSERLHADITVGKVYLNFGHNYHIGDICILDQSADTLAFFEDIKALSDTAGISNTVFKKIDIKNPKIFIKTDTAGHTNYDFLVKFFSSDTQNPDTATSDLPLLICDDFNITDGKFRYINTSVKERKDSVLTFVPEDMLITDANLSIQNLIIGDSLIASVSELNFKEKSGLIVEKIAFDINHNPQKTEIRNLTLMTAKSSAEARKITYSEINNKPNALVKLNYAYIHSDELALIEPRFKNANIYINIETEMQYTGNNARIQNMILEIGETSDIYSDIRIDNIKNRDSLKISAAVQEFKTNVKDIEQILNDINLPVSLPPELKTLETFYFSGRIENQASISSASGKIESNAGDILLDISAKEDSAENTLALNINIKDANLNLSKILQNNTIGNIQFSANANVVFKDDILSEFHGQNQLKSCVLNHYKYQNIDLNVDYRQGIVKTSLCVKDRNLKLCAKGQYNTNIGQSAGRFSIDLKHAELNKLNIYKAHKTVDLRAYFAGEFTGSTLDDIAGFVGLTDVMYKIPNDSIQLISLIANSEHSERQRVFKINSDYFDMDIRGTYKLASLEEAAKKFLASYIPVYKTSYDPEKLADNKNRIINLTADFKNLSKLNQFFFPEISISDSTHIEAFFKTDNALLDMSIQIPYLKTGADSLKNIRIESYTLNNALNISASCSYICSDTLLSMERVRYQGDIKNNILHSILSMHNNGSLVFGGDIAVETRFDYKNKKLKTRSKFEPTRLKLAGMPWMLSADELLTSDTHIELKNMRLKHDEQEIKLHGIAGTQHKDSLQIHIRKFNLKNLQNFVNDSLFNFSGYLNVDAAVYAPLGNTQTKTNSQIIDFQINKQKFGTVNIDADIDKNKNMQVQMSAQNSKNRFTCIGSLSENNELELNAVINHLDARIAGAVLGNDIQITNGYATGYAQIFGNINQPKWNATLNLKKIKTKIKYLNCDFLFSSLMAVDNNMIQIAKTEIFDNENNKAVFSAEASHRDFSDFKFDIDFETDKFLVLNTDAFSDEDYYGKLYAGGKVKLTGNPDLIFLKANLKTLPKSELIIKTEINQSADNQNLIQFVSDSSTVETVFKEQDFSHLNLDFDLTISPETKFKILMSSQSDDAVKAQGLGDLHINTNERGDIEITGTYDIYKGDYLFTIADVYSMQFFVKEGSRLQWRGDPYDALMDITAYYPVRRVRLYDLILEEYAKTVFYPVNCNISLSESIESPNIKFGVEIGGFGQKYNAKLNSLSESNMNKQFLSLLVLGSFQPLPSIAQNNENNTELDAAEILSGQLSNLLSGLSEDVEIGVSYKKNEETQKDELELDFSTGLFNDRVILNGNVAKGEYRNTTSEIVGDFDAEIKITPDGNLKMKVYNKSNRDLSYSTAAYTQGVGIFYRREFNRIFRKRNKSKADTLNTHP